MRALLWWAGDYLYITGFDPKLSYRRKIDAGAFAEVHEVCIAIRTFAYTRSTIDTRALYLARNYEADMQGMARKLLRPFGGITQEDIENEARAITKLCGQGQHNNIVEVLQHGKLPNSPYYFIDMELCDINLDMYIEFICKPSSRPDLPGHLPITGNANAFLYPDQMAIIDILRDITNGVVFIHDHQEIHRDLKPRNSNSKL
jgi:serine/threonine protein kinase